MLENLNYETKNEATQTLLPGKQRMRKKASQRVSDYSIKPTSLSYAASSFSEMLLSPLVNELLAGQPHQFVTKTVSIVFRFIMVPYIEWTMNRCQLNDSTTELETMSNNRGTVKFSTVYLSVNQISTQPSKFYI